MNPISKPDNEDGGRFRHDSGGSKLKGPGEAFYRLMEIWAREGEDAPKLEIPFPKLMCYTLPLMEMECTTEREMNRVLRAMVKNVSTMLRPIFYQDTLPETRRETLPKPTEDQKKRYDKIRQGMKSCGIISTEISTDISGDISTISFNGAYRFYNPEKTDDRGAYESNKKVGSDAPSISVPDFQFRAGLETCENNSLMKVNCELEHKLEELFDLAYELGILDPLEQIEIQKGLQRGEFDKRIQEWKKP